MGKNPRMPVKILQINVARKRVAHDVAFLTAKRKEVDILIATEPNKKLLMNKNWVHDNGKDVAIYFINKRLPVANTSAGNGHIMVQLEYNNLSIWGIYISPNIKMEEYKKQVDEVMLRIQQTCHAKHILGGDINAKSPLWGGSFADAKGQHWGDWLAQLDMAVINEGSEPTFRRGNSSSIIDVTFATNNISSSIKNWRMLEEDSMSDHMYIYYEIGRDIDIRTEGLVPIGYNKDKFRTELIKHNMESNITRASWSTKHIKIQKAYKYSIIYNRAERRKPPYWWNEEIEQLLRSTKELRRRATREPPTSTRWTELREEYRDKRKRVKKKINEIKRNKWKELLQELDNDSWGNGYKIATQSLKTKGTPFRMSLEKRREEISNLFVHSRNDMVMHIRNIGEVAPFTTEEMRVAILRLKPGRAAGVDGIPPEAVRDAANWVPDMMLDMYNELLRSGVFPKVWKMARVVLIPKERGYRPICLIDVLGKVYERLLTNRLQKILEEKGALSDSQYGFRPGRSTIDALEAVSAKARRTKYRWLMLITLDVRNAFNMAPWNRIIEKLTQLEVPAYLQNIIASYLSDRRIIITKNESLETTAGVPQGSVPGPTLWNIMYDGVLRLKLDQRVTTLAYADDLALLVEGEDKTQLKVMANRALTKIGKWMKENGLTLAPEKTEAIILKGPRDRTEMGIVVDGRQITPGKALKYLGVIIDDKMIFGEHVKAITAKAERAISSLVKLMPNVGGPKGDKRALYCNVADSILTYAAPIWYCVTHMAKYKQMLEGVQRKMLIRAACAYRTASGAALQVIVGRVPIDLLIQERERIHRDGSDISKVSKKKVHRENTIEIWQRLWQTNTGKSQWTKSLIKDLRGWLKCGHRQTEYHLTQFLTGHGAIGTYLKRFGKRESENCSYCNEVDEPGHAVFHCNKFVNKRTRLELEIRNRITADNIIDLMIGSEGNWRKIHKLIKEIFQTKEEEERVRQSRR